MMENAHENLSGRGQRSCALNAGFGANGTRNTDFCDNQKVNSDDGTLRTDSGPTGDDHR